MARSSSDPVTGLSEQQRLFADHYLVCFNAVQAYEKAGYAAKGRARDAAASRLLNRKDVTTYLQARMDRISARLELSTERVLTELQRVAFFDPRRVLAADGGIKPVDEWDDNAAAAVQSLEVDEIFAGKGEDRVQIGLAKKIKLHPKVPALEKLGQHLGLFAKKVEVTGKDGKPIEHEHTLAQAIVDEVAGSDTGIGPARGRKGSNDR